jgi:hypothetical protein
MDSRQAASRIFAASSLFNALRERAQGLARDGNPEVAITGRAMLGLTLPFLEWFRGELRAGTEPKALSAAFVEAIGGAVAGFIRETQRAPGASETDAARWIAAEVTRVAVEKIGEANASV